MRAVFLDREGVITPKLGPGEYLLDAARATLAPGVATSLAQLHARRSELFIVSNQSCIGRGLLSPEDSNAIHAKILTELADAGIDIAGSRICPHTDDDDCACRKPKPGMILDLCALHGIPPAECAMIGDSLADVEAGAAAGCAALYLLSVEAPAPFPSGTQIVPTLSDAVSRILSSHT